LPSEPASRFRAATALEHCLSRRNASSSSTTHTLKATSYIAEGSLITAEAPKSQRDRARFGSINGLSANIRDLG
jgi:hypothetical protein